MMASANTTDPSAGAPRPAADGFRLDIWASRPPCIEVLATGPSATVQDLGRPGLAELGVGPSGAADRPSLRLANRLVGNPESHAGIEFTFGGLVLRFTRAALIAFAGAPCPLWVCRVSGASEASRAGDMYAPIYVYAGDEVRVGPPSAGMRSYLAVRGGIAVPPVLGARATDTLAGLGPSPLMVGSLLPIGDAAMDYPNAGFAPQRAYPDRPALRVLPGPRDHWLVDGALDALCDPAGYEVTAESNRIGMRLAGPVLRHRHIRELPPEATVSGALQVPPSGQPILFLADHPVTGGYPVIAVVHPDDLPMAAQARPGQRVRFVPDREQRRFNAEVSAEKSERHP
ncbi:MAG: biotin-dependent carboxyltransferase family protein [Pseudonocardia sp.]